MTESTKRKIAIEAHSRLGHESNSKFVEAFSDGAEFGYQLAMEEMKVQPKPLEPFNPITSDENKEPRP